MAKKVVTRSESERAALIDKILGSRGLPKGVATLRRLPKKGVATNNIRALKAEPSDDASRDTAVLYLMYELQGLLRLDADDADKHGQLVLDAYQLAKEPGGVAARRRIMALTDKLLEAKRERVGLIVQGLSRGR